MTKNAPFQPGQRVRIWMTNRWYYGIVQAATTAPGMSLMNENRLSKPGEYAFLVSSYRNPRGGALWYSASGLRPMHKDSKPKA